VPVAIEGAGKQEHWAETATLEPLVPTSADEGDGLVHILSPFDPLIIQRKRTELFFDYGHRFEAYVPKEKRLFGYFALPVVLEGAGKQEHWARPETLEPQPLRGEGGLVHILSPFDPLIIQRKRTELFFDYGHRFEAYVPREKRLFGYFALPVLVGEDIVAAIDLKTDRKNKKLLMQKWNWVGKGAAKAPRKEYKRRIEEELDRFERFQLAE